MAFVMFLACLFQTGVYDVKTDSCAVGLIVFGKYMNLVRKLQMTYRMEPAGSQGQHDLTVEAQCCKANILQTYAEGFDYRFFLIGTFKNAKL